MCAHAVDFKTAHRISSPTIRESLTLKLTEAEHNERGMSIAWPLEFAEALKSADNLRASFINGLQLSDD